MFLSCAKMQNTVLVGRSRNLSVLGRAKLHHIWFVSRKVAQIFRLRKVTTYPFWVAMAATYLFWVAQSRNTSILGSAKSHHICFVSRKVAQILRSRKVATYPLWVAVVATYIFWVAQIRNKPLRLRKVTTNFFESQWPQHTFFGSRKFASYLFWVAQSRAKISVAQSRNLPILSRNGRNIHFLGRANSQ